MGDVSFSDRFELLELLRDEDVQTFRARERATGRAVEAHFSASSERLAEIDAPNVVDRGSHEGKLYVVTKVLGLDSAGAWQVKSQTPAPGDFTRMFELRQAPEPVAAPVAKAVQSPSTQAGEFTRAFQKPAAAPATTPANFPEPGQPGEFTRMFQTPAPPPSAQPVASPIETPPDAPPARNPVGLILLAIVMITAIGVYVFVRTLY